jgi:hypothetical protein
MLFRCYHEAFMPIRRCEEWSRGCTLWVSCVQFHGQDQPLSDLLDVLLRHRHHMGIHADIEVRRMESGVYIVSLARLIRNSRLAHKACYSNVITAGVYDDMKIWRTESFMGGWLISPRRNRLNRRMVGRSKAQVMAFRGKFFFILSVVDPGH